jgi:hypothetical protein
MFLVFYRAVVMARRLRHHGPMKRALIIGLCLLAPITGAGAADDLFNTAITDSDWAYLAKFGVKPDNQTIRHIDLKQKVHLHYLINDPQIQNRDAEVDYYLDYVTLCPKMLIAAGVEEGSCDTPPPGHP